MSISIGKQLEKMIGNLLKQRGYRYYSDRNYIVVGDNLVAVSYLYATTKKQLVVNLRFKKSSYDKLYFELMKGSNYHIKVSDIFAPNSVPFIYGKSLVLPIDYFDTDTIFQTASSLVESIDIAVMEYGRIDVNSVVLEMDKTYRLKALALLDMGHIEDLLCFCETRVYQYKDDPESDFGTELYLQILDKYDHKMSGSDDKTQTDCVSTYLLDDIRWQIDSAIDWYCEKYNINRDDLNDDDERKIELFAANIPGAYIAWLATSSRIGSFHMDNDNDAVNDIIEHRITGAEFIVDFCDGKLTKEDICDKENNELCAYYVESYLDDYFDFLRMNKMEVMDVVFDGPVIDKFVAFIEERYNKWGNKR